MRRHTEVIPRRHLALATEQQLLRLAQAILRIPQTASSSFATQAKTGTASDRGV
jgi:hypothetical protein